MGKLYATLVHERVYDWAENAKVRAEGQAGFRRDRRCSDQIMVVRTLAETAKAAGKKLFMCFVDFEKAYDLVNRDLLWEKLAAREMPVGLIDAVKVIYADVPMFVRTSIGPTATFQSTQGVKQGCPLSPTLFGLYIDDLEDEIINLDPRQSDLPLLDGIRVPPLLYADDLALASYSYRGLGAQLAVLQKYCVRWKLKLNVSKTVLVAFGSRQKSGHALLQWEGTALHWADSFVYLGADIPSNIKTMWRSMVDTLRKKAVISTLSLNLRCRHLGLTDCKVKRDLYNAVIQPKVSHACEIWSTQGLATGIAESCDLAKLQRRFYRQCLGVQRSCPTNVLFAEIASYPLAVLWTAALARYWDRLVTMHPERITARAFKAQLALLTQARQGLQPATACWATQAVAALERAGLHPMLGGVPTLVGTAAADSAPRGDFLHRIQSDASSKTRRYFANVRGPLELQSFKPPAYLFRVHSRRQRSQLARVRIGTPWFAVFDREEGELVDREEGELVPCSRCDIAVTREGLEEHVLLHCAAFSNVRHNFPTLFPQSTPQSLSQLHSKDSTQLALYIDHCMSIDGGTGDYIDGAN